MWWIQKTEGQEDLGKFIRDNKGSNEEWEHEVKNLETNVTLNIEQLF